MRSHRPTPRTSFLAVCIHIGYNKLVLAFGGFCAHPAIRPSLRPQPAIQIRFSRLNCPRTLALGPRCLQFLLRLVVFTAPWPLLVATLSTTSPVRLGPKPASIVSRQPTPSGGRLARDGSPLHPQPITRLDTGDATVEGLARDSRFFVESPRLPGTRIQVRSIPGRDGGARRPRMAITERRDTADHVIEILDEEFEDFTTEARAYLAGQRVEEKFIGYRLKQGVYGQRQPNVQMLRVKLPMGGVTADQLDAFAEVAERFAPLKKGHITTRENIQLHHIPLPLAWESLLWCSVAPGCQRAKPAQHCRNVTGDPWAGVAARRER